MHIYLQAEKEPHIIRSYKHFAQVKKPIDHTVAAGAESENMLLYLISSLRRSNEPKPAWFIKDVAIEELQKKFGLEAAVASEIFEDLKAELFKALDIEVPVVKKMSEEELNEKKKEIERLLSSV